MATGHKNPREYTDGSMELITRLSQVPRLKFIKFYLTRLHSVPLRCNNNFVFTVQQE
jgi:hypothetical protein